MAAQQYFLALDLKDDPALIAEYKAYHQNVWPEIIDSIKSAGITCLDIYCVANRLFMVLEAVKTFLLKQSLRQTLQMKWFKNGKH